MELLIKSYVLNLFFNPNVEAFFNCREETMSFDNSFFLNEIYKKPSFKSKLIILSEGFRIKESPSCITTGQKKLASFFGAGLPRWHRHGEFRITSGSARHVARDA